jgi:hypothetical protein
MKKILLTTTALMTVFCMHTALAAPKKKKMLKKEVHAHSPIHVNVSGVLDAQAGFRSQSSKHVKNAAGEKIGVTKYNKDVGFDTEGRINVEAKGKTQKGLLYGANIGVDVNVSDSLDSEINGKKSSSLMKRRTFVYLEDKDMGRLELGNREGASETMLPTAEGVAVATGGIGGDWYKYVQTSTVPRTDGSFTETVTTNNFYMGAGSLLDNGTDMSSTSQKSRKVTYYTPKIKDTGLGFGISYIPDSKNNVASYPNNGVSALNVGNVPDAKKGDKGYKNGFVAAIDWQYKINKDNTFKMAVVGERGELPKTLKSSFHKAQTVGVGATHMYKDFSGVISYNYLGKSGLQKGGTEKVKKNNYVATLGFAYDIDHKTKVSLTGLMSEKWKNKFYNISLGAQYQLAPGLLPYAEVSFFDMKQKYNYVSDGATYDSASKKWNTNLPAAAKGKNKGTSFIIGTKVAF